MLVENCKPLLVQQNVDGSTFFHRPWAAFKEGFGNPAWNYWLGNELLHELTKTGQYKVRFDLQSLATSRWYWAEYSTFIVDTEANWYGLTIGGYSGDAGNPMAYHNGRNFSTFDSDNDNHNHNCAAGRRGGFWYKHCARAHINTPDGAGGLFNTMGWAGKAGALLTCRVWLICR